MDLISNVLILLSTLEIYFDVPPKSYKFPKANIEVDTPSIRKQAQRTVICLRPHAELRRNAVMDTSYFQTNSTMALSRRSVLLRLSPSQALVWKLGPQLTIFAGDGWIMPVLSMG